MYGSARRTRSSAGTNEHTPNTSGKAKKLASPTTSIIIAIGVIFSILALTSTLPSKPIVAPQVNAAHSRKPNQPRLDPNLNRYHVIVTSDGGPYQAWMTRICYHSYQKVKAAHPDGPMGGFTRLLHSNNSHDALITIIPTIRVKELPTSLIHTDKYLYPPLNRPWAYLEFIVGKHLDEIPERYILMSEPDHIFLSPPPLPTSPTIPIAAPFWYMNATDVAASLEKYNSKEIPWDKFYPTGNAPAIIAKAQLAEIVESWYTLTVDMLKHDETRNSIGWVLEMYGWVVAAATAPSVPLEFDLLETLKAEPPRDSIRVGGHGDVAHILHFTYGACIDSQTKRCTHEFDRCKEDGWQWDKRNYLTKYPPKNYPLPPLGCDSEGVNILIEMLNEVSASIDEWDALS